MEKIVVGNLKMNLKEEDVEEYIKNINLFKNNNIDLYIAPSFIYLEKFRSNKYHLTAQDVSEYKNGNYTGEISASQLKSIGVDSVIIGHSERRKLFNETSEIIHLKVKEAIKNDLKVFLCVNEKDTINELNKILNGVNKKQNIIITYEPEYAIGTGISAKLEDISNAVKKIKEKFNLKVIYGGSVNLNNVDDIAKICDGVIIGKMSINVNNFTKMISNIQ